MIFSLGNIPRKIKVISVASKLLFKMMPKGYINKNNIITIKGIPKDAVYVDSLFDPSTLTAYIVFEHNTFELIKPGEIIPELFIEFIIKDNK